MFAQGRVGARLAADPGHGALTHQLPTSDQLASIAQDQPQDQPYVSI